MLVDVTATNSFGVSRPRIDAFRPEHRHPVLEPAGAVRDHREAGEPHALLTRGEGGVVGRHHLQRPGRQPIPEPVLVDLAAEGRRHNPLGGIVPVLVEIFRFIQREMLDQRLAIDPHALLARAPNGLVRLLAGDMHDVERYARRISDHDCTVGGLALHLRLAANRRAPPAR